MNTNSPKFPFVSRAALCLAIAASTATSASGAILLEFTFTGTNPAESAPEGTIAASTVDPNVSGSGFGAPFIAAALETRYRTGSAGHEATGTQIVNAPAGVTDGLLGTQPALLYDNHFSWLIQNGHNAPGNALSASITNNEYVTFTITPDVSMDITSISFDHWHNASGGAANRDNDIAVFTSIGGFTDGAQIATYASSAAGSIDESLVYQGIHSRTIDLSGNPLFEDLTDPVEIRLYFYGSSFGVHNSGIHQWIDNVEVEGIAVIPEPGTCAALIGVLALAWAGIRRRVRSTCAA